jgi:hypothetical protein
VVRIDAGKGMGELLLLPAVQVDITPFSERTLVCYGFVKP